MSGSSPVPLGKESSVSTEQKLVVGRRVRLNYLEKRILALAGNRSTTPQYNFGNISKCHKIVLLTVTTLWPQCVSEELQLSRNGDTITP
jgi:hypothetical protein